MKSKIVIFDLDGTLADIEDRRKLSTRENGKIHWGMFFDPKNIAMDLPNLPVIETFKALQSAGFKCIIFSGRGSATRTATVEWLSKFDIKPDILKMRPINSFTPDEILKRDWLNSLESEYGITKEDILCIFDDRDKVVKMWREEGLTCMQVAPGAF
jgi:hydroxymethylpyrimidine pyrophosphatase-like HAD family hydrolase